MRHSTTLLAVITLLGCAHHGPPAATPAELASATDAAVAGWLASHHAKAAPVRAITWRRDESETDLPVATAVPDPPGQAPRAERFYRVGDELAVRAARCDLGAACAIPMTYRLATTADGGHTLVRIVADPVAVPAKGCEPGAGGMMIPGPPPPHGVDGLSLGAIEPSRLALAEVHVRVEVLTYTCHEPQRP